MKGGFEQGFGESHQYIHRVREWGFKGGSIRTPLSQTIALVIDHPLVKMT